MRLLKKNYKFIIGFVLGVLLASGVTAFASYTYFSSDVKYGNKSVEDALNEIYEYQNQTSKIYYLGTGTSFDVKSKLPDKYQQLSNDNFIVGTVSAPAKYAQYRAGNNHIYTSGGFKGFTLNKSYDSGTGKLTVSGNSYTAWTFIDDFFSDGSRTDATANGSVTPYAYVVVGNIQ